MKNFILILIFPILLSCGFENTDNKELINTVILSQNYDGEIISLVSYALITIFFFFIIGFIGNRKNKK